MATLVAKIVALENYIFDLETKYEKMLELQMAPMLTQEELAVQCDKKVARLTMAFDSANDLINRLQEENDLLYEWCTRVTAETGETPPELKKHNRE
jgi:hypothetical protein